MTTRNIPDRRVAAQLRRMQANTAEQAATPTKPQPQVQAHQQEQAHPQTRPREPSLWRELGGLAVKVIVITLCAALVFTFVYGFHQVTDPDMRPMVKTGDLVLFYRLDQDYAIGDLLLLDFQGERQVRRVVARAGDVVDMIDGTLSINGALQQESDIYQQTWPYEGGVTFPLTVGTGQVFVLGDARDNATDGRVYGPVDTKDTLGTVITILRRRSL